MTKIRGYKIDLKFNLRKLVYLFKDRSLSFKTLLITWGVTSIFTVLFTTLQIFYEYKSEKEQLYNTFDIINDLYVAPLSESLWIMNKSIINTQSNSLLGYPFVSYIKVFDEETVYFEEGNHDKKTFRTFDLAFNSQKIGKLEIGLNTKLLEQKFMKRVMVTVLIQGLKAIFVCIILFFAYEFLITRSLRRVSNFLVTHPDATTKGEKIPFDYDREDELGILVQNLNNFIEYIFGLNKSLTSLNNDLERKVDERTKEIKGKNDQLLRAIKDLEKAHSQIASSEKLASLGKMTAGIAHEIKNPVYIVVNSVSLVKELLIELLEELPDEAQKHIDQELVKEINDLCERSEHNCERVGNIINSMLSLSRGSENKKEDVNMIKLLKSSCEFAYDAFRAKNNFSCKIDYNIDVAEAFANIYKVELSRSLINIVDNALYSMKRKSMNISDYKGFINIRVQKVNKSLVVTISDNGEGIDPEVKEHIFSPFFTTKPSGEGTGLGMSMTYDIIKKHGGDITLESKLGEGAQFRIELPLV